MYESGLQSSWSGIPVDHIANAEKYALTPRKYHLEVLAIVGLVGDNKPGNQKKITHQYSLKLLITSEGIMTNKNLTKNPTSPEKNLNDGLQNL